MSEIINKPTVIGDEKTDLVRAAIEHRATWFYLVLKEAQKKGCDIEEIGRAAIRQCGEFHSEVKFKPQISDPDDMLDFGKAFANDTYRKVFEMDYIENTKDKLYVNFHYCPLVEAWKKLGVPDEEMPLLCDIAMDGDRGICAGFEGYDFKLGKVIAKNEGICEIRIDKK